MTPAPASGERTWRLNQGRECVECVMAWLLYGDGAVCLAGHGKVYWNGAAK